MAFSRRPVRGRALPSGRGTSRCGARRPRRRRTSGTFCAGDLRAARGAARRRGGRGRPGSARAFRNLTTAAVGRRIPRTCVAFASCAPASVLGRQETLPSMKSVLDRTSMPVIPAECGQLTTTGEATTQFGCARRGSSCSTRPAPACSSTPSARSCLRWRDHPDGLLRRAAPDALDRASRRSRPQSTTELTTAHGPGDTTPLLSTIQRVRV